MDAYLQSRRHCRIPTINGIEIVNLVEDQLGVASMRLDPERACAAGNGASCDKESGT